MRISSEWLNNAPNAAPEERATVCDFRIWVGDTNVATHFDDDEKIVLDYVTLPTYSIVEGLARDWWGIFGGRDREHSLVRHRMGYAVPDVNFRFDGTDFTVSAEQRPYNNPHVRFWGGPDEILPRAEAENILAGFIGETVARLDDEGIVETSASARWARVQQSRKSPEEAAFCEAAGALRLDPYTIEETDAVFIEQVGQIFSGEPMIEFLAGLAGRESRRENMIAWIQSAEGRPGYQSRLPVLVDLIPDISSGTPKRKHERSWALGYRRARAARAALALEQTETIGSATKLAEKFGNPSFRRVRTPHGLLAMVSREHDDVRVHLRDQQQGTSSRQSLWEKFALARAIGDAICFPEDDRSVLNDLRDASRQAAGRAFAAEFLAPSDEVISMVHDGYDQTEIAGTFKVAPEVIARQIENAKRIELACAA